MADIFDKLQLIVERYRSIEAEMAQPEVAADYARLGELNRERSGLEDLVAIDVQRRNLAEEQADLRALITEGGDPELVEMAQLELDDVDVRLFDLAQQLRIALLPRDPNDERDVIVEIHAAAGGQEASLFAADLYRMYQRYAQEQGWSVDILNSNPSDLGGFSRMAFSVDGRNAFSKLKFEAGVHRVQRVPETEAQGRIHTSTATVAVMPQADEVEVNVKEDDLRIDIFHAGGHGGQNVNKVATAVQLRFDAAGSPTLPPAVRQRLLRLAGSRVTADGTLVITARRYRTQEANRRDARARLAAMIARALAAPRPRRATRPTRAAQERRLQGKAQRGAVKRQRTRPGDDD
jgi:peptide chain release factor 1